MKHCVQTIPITSKNMIRHDLKPEFYFETGIGTLFLSMAVYKKTTRKDIDPGGGKIPYDTVPKDVMREQI